MFVLVTQADGSARRITWVTFALAACLIAVYVQQVPSRDIAAGLETEITDFVTDHPYVEVAPRYEFLVPLEYANEIREVYFEERRSLGLPLMSGRTIERGQREFDELLDIQLRKVESLPAWHYGIWGSDYPVTNLLAHFAVRDTQFALLASLFFLLSLGIALEDGWGPILFGCLALAGTAFTGVLSAAVSYPGAAGMPWYGPSGLVSVLLGAYFVRSLRASARLVGAIPMPGFLMVLGWLATEYIGVRGVDSVSTFVLAPAIVHALGFGLGSVVSLGVMLLGFERKMFERTGETEELVSNPVLDRAMQAKDDGRLDVAFDLLRREFRRAPDNLDAAMALWDVALEIDKAPNVVESIIAVIQDNTKRGHSSQAVHNWFLVKDHVPGYKPKPQLCVRVGEALLDEGHPEAALELLNAAVASEAGLSTTMAQRVVRIARDLDPDLTRRAADIALADPKLGMVERDELEALSGEVVAVAPILPVYPDAQDPPVRQASAATASAPSPAAPGGASDLDLENSAERDWSGQDVEDLDPQAIRLDEVPDNLMESVASADGSDSWNTPGLDDDFGSDLLDDIDDLDADALEEAVLDAGLLSEEQAKDMADPRSATVTEVAMPSSIPRAGETATEVDLSPDPVDDTATIISPQPPRRALRVRNAVPIRLESDALVVEVESGNKTRLPYKRVEALAAAAVKGISSKPVVIVDVVLNWRTAAEPLKVIRLRSDRFDPCALTPGVSSPVESLRKLLSDILETSGAVPLPHFSGATGSPFGMFPNLAEYEGEVLLADSEHPDSAS